MKYSKNAFLCFLGCLTIGSAVLSPFVQANTVTEWNQNALETLAAASEPRTPLATRILAMVHAAIHDSINAIDPRFDSYAADVIRRPGASAEVAVAVAAYTVLSDVFPAQQGTLYAKLQKTLSAIPDGPAKMDGIILGVDAASQILRLRRRDGLAEALATTYDRPPSQGIWRPTPPALAPAAFPGWRLVHPFALKSADQFRLPPPPALGSPQERADLAEVMMLGRDTSTVRSDDQTEAALFWQENGQITFGHVGQDLATRFGLDLWQTAHLFALLYVSMADAAIAGFDSKYEYAFWRPITSIREDPDGDLGWNPLTPTPAHPDYPSQHAAIFGVFETVFGSIFGDDVSFQLTTSTAPMGVIRSYPSFSAVAIEGDASRVWLGYHFRTATVAGREQGDRVAQYVIDNFMRAR